MSRPARVRTWCTRRARVCAAHLDPERRSGLITHHLSTFHRGHTSTRRSKISRPPDARRYRLVRQGIRFKQEQRPALHDAAASRDLPASTRRPLCSEVPGVAGLLREPSILWDTGGVRGCVVCVVVWCAWLCGVLGCVVYVVVWCAWLCGVRGCVERENL
jgi:hypothetical protein